MSNINSLRDLENRRLVNNNSGSAFNFNTMTNNNTNIRNEDVR